MSDLFSYSYSFNNGQGRLVIALELDDGNIKSYNVRQGSENYDRVKFLAESILGLNDSYYDGSSTDELVDELINTLDKKKNIDKHTRQISEVLGKELAFENGVFSIDGEPVVESLQNQLVAIGINNDGWDEFTKFVSLLYDNMDSYVRDQLFNWMDAVSREGNLISINEDGYIIGYKGVVKNDTGCALRDNDGNEVRPDFYSVNSGVGTAIEADGTVHEFSGSNIPNFVGGYATIPREMVNSNPHIGCSTGLHVGTYTYARSFSQGAVLMVLVNPKDVVSVPSDCDNQKVRASKYKIVKVMDNVEVEDLPKNPVFRDRPDFDPNAAHEFDTHFSGVLRYSTRDDGYYYIDEDEDDYYDEELLDEYSYVDEEDEDEVESESETEDDDDPWLEHVRKDDARRAYDSDRGDTYRRL